MLSRCTRLFQLSKTRVQHSLVLWFVFSYWPAARTMVQSSAPLLSSSGIYMQDAKGGKGHGQASGGKGGKGGQCALVPEVIVLDPPQLHALDEGRADHQGEQTSMTSVGPSTGAHGAGGNGPAAMQECDEEEPDTVMVADDLWTMSDGDQPVPMGRDFLRSQARTGLFSSAGVPSSSSEETDRCGPSSFVYVLLFLFCDVVHFR